MDSVSLLLRGYVAGVAIWEEAAQWEGVLAGKRLLIAAACAIVLATVALKLIADFLQ